MVVATNETPEEGRVQDQELTAPVVAMTSVMTVVWAFVPIAAQRIDQFHSHFDETEARALGCGPISFNRMTKGRRQNTTLS